MGYERERELNVMNSIIVSCLLQLMMPHVLQTLTSYIICIGHVLELVSSFCFVFTVPCVSLMLYQFVPHVIVEAVRVTEPSPQGYVRATRQKSIKFSGVCNLQEVLSILI